MNLASERLGGLYIHPAIIVYLVVEIALKIFTKINLTPKLEVIACISWIIIQADSTSFSGGTKIDLTLLFKNIIINRCSLNSGSNMVSCLNG